MIRVVGVVCRRKKRRVQNIRLTTQMSNVSLRHEQVLFLLAIVQGVFHHGDPIKSDPYANARILAVLC